MLGEPAPLDLQMWFAKLHGRRAAKVRNEMMAAMLGLKGFMSRWAKEQTRVVARARREKELYWVYYYLTRHMRLPMLARHLIMQHGISHIRTENDKPVVDIVPCGGPFGPFEI